MTFDLVVGKSSKAKDAPDIVGGIDFDELPAASRLLERVDSSFLQRISAFYQDASFSTDEVDQALDELLPLLRAPLRADERILLHKLIAVLAYAKSVRQPLHGVAD